MKVKVRISLCIICSLLCSACTNPAAQAQKQPPVAATQDTLEMVPDFSYAVTEQVPHILVDRIGYRTQDKKTAFFVGQNLDKKFFVRDLETDEVIFEGSLFAVKEMDEKELYIGDFSAVTEEGKYYLYHTETGDSHEFAVNDSIYGQEYLVLQKVAKEYTYTNVRDLAYCISNMMFMKEMYDGIHVDYLFVEDSLRLLLNSQDVQSGAFINEISEVPDAVGTASLTTTAQMAGVLAQYSYLYKNDNPEFSMECLKAGQNAYKYMENYRKNTDTDAWYFAAVQLYRATGQYKYRNAIREYDTMETKAKSSTGRDYTMLADFTYLSTAYGTDYARCETLLDGYMDKAEAISLSSVKENLYVSEDIEAMGDSEILDNIIILGLVNHVLSGQEYAGVQKNYLHYFSGVNLEAKNYLLDEMTAFVSVDGPDITKIAKLMVIFGNMN